MIGYRSVQRHLLRISHRLAGMTYEVGQIAKYFAIAFPISCLVCAVFLAGNQWWWSSSPWIYRHFDLYIGALLISMLMPAFIGEGFVLLGAVWLVLRTFVRYSLHKRKCS